MRVSYNGGVTVFECDSVEGERWNGFVKPLFTFGQGVEVANWDGMRGEFWTIDDDNVDEFWVSFGRNADGERLYSIGGGSWSWLIVDEG